MNVPQDHGEIVTRIYMLYYKDILYEDIFQDDFLVR